jgi:Tfp pilus assembly protein PilO
MPRNFNLRGILPKGDGWKDPRFLVRVVLGLLLVANLAAAGIAFNLFGPSPEALDAQLMSARARLQADQTRLMRSRLLSSNIGKGKTDGDTFLTSYFTTRRRTYSTIISEITEIAKGAGMKAQEWTIAPLDPIEGSDDLSMMTVAVNFEGGYAQLVKFANALDRSPRFLIIESMQATPQPKGDILTVTLKLNAFIKDDSEL